MKYLTFIKKNIKWSDIKILPQNKLIKSSYFWFALVPIIAKILNKIEVPLTLNINQNILIDMNLPFSWKIFYISSLLIVIANILFFVFCPKIIKEFNDYSEFKKSGRNSNNLIDYIPQSNSALLEEIQKIFKKVESEGDNWVDEEIYLKKLDNQLQANFWKIYNNLNESKQKMRIISYILYSIGIAFFVIVILQNIWFTIKQML